MTQRDESASPAVDLGMSDRVYVIAACPEPECGGWAAAHFSEGVGGMWHNHDGRHVDFVRVELVAYDWAQDQINQWAGS
jgi:hypothetical protein